ncbi:MAG: OmpA family protein [Myxococcota bacterium]
MEPALDDVGKARRNLIMGGIVLAVLVGGVAGFYLLVWNPLQDTVQDAIVDSTSSKKDYDHTIRLALDSFKGYSVLRSDALQRELDRDSIRLITEDDGADYGKRLDRLAKGDIQMAVFTVATNLITSSARGDFPGAMVLVIDESKGADAIGAYKEAVPNVSALNRPDARIVAIPNSPNEIVARHMVAGMLPRLADQDWMVTSKSAQDTLRRIKDADRSSTVAYALWEPELSEAIQIDGFHIIYDTSKTERIVVDILMVNRAFLASQPKRVQQFCEAYLTTLYSYSNRNNGIVELLMDDGRKTGEALTRSQAERIAKELRFANTLENYAYFGLLGRDQAQGLPTMDVIISRIAGFLIKSGKLKSNPAKGREHELYFDGVLRDMQRADFHPGEGELDAVRGAKALPALSPEEWRRLIKVGNMDARSIGFKRGQSELSVQGKRDVNSIVSALQGWPDFYLTVKGNARAEGDPQKNLELAKARAEVVATRIVQLGINTNRVRAVAEPPDQTGGEAQSVTFVLSQRGY